MKAKPWDRWTPRHHGKGIRRPLPYVRVQVQTPPSRKGYFLLVVDLGAFREEWMYSKN